MLLFLNFLSNEIKSMNGYLYSINFIIEISIMIKFFKKAAFYGRSKIVETSRELGNCF